MKTTPFSHMFLYQMNNNEICNAIVVEILPFAIRAKGLALFWLVTGATGAFNTYVNPLGIDAFAWKYYFFYVGWIIIQFIIVYLFFIEVCIFRFPYLDILIFFSLSCSILLRYAVIHTDEIKKDQRPKSGTDCASIRWKRRYRCACQSRSERVLGNKS